MKTAGMTLVVFLGLCASSSGADEPAGKSGAWLNVQEEGASGSRFETKATTTADSNEIVVADPGDFKVGQGITVSRSSIRILSPTLWGPQSPYGSSKPLGDAVEIRGYDGSTSSWLVFLLEIDSAQPLSFRWSDTLVHAGKWQGVKVPITWDWQRLSNGVEVRFRLRDLKPGHMISFAARDQLTTVVEKIDGRTFTLRHAANRTVRDAVVRHDDSLAIQATVNRAIRQKRNVFFPVGWYRVPGGISVSGAGSICLEGASGVDTVMDMTEGATAIFSVRNCTELTIRNFRMIGHTGMAEAAGSFQTSSGFGFWACALKGGNAVTMTGTERALLENIHASRMASECFYAHGTSRQSRSEPTPYQSQDKPCGYQKSLIYHRCSVTDCAANAFNNNDMGENTSVLYCRIDGAGWHAAEMPARFLKLVGNYVRNAGAFTVGDMSHRYDDLHRLGCGQAIVAHNVFEGLGNSGGIGVNHGSSQVTIADNLFINYNGPAITVASSTVRTSFPSNTVTVTGNIIDLTYSGDKVMWRTGINISASNAVVANNQVYVRGQWTPNVTGIAISEPAINVTVHDNLIRNCQRGLVTRRAGSTVTTVVDYRTFLDRENGIPLEWKDSHCYRGWNLLWLDGDRPGAVSVIDAFDPETLRFKLKEPHPMKPGNRFQVFPRAEANWNIHDNTITGCQEPMVLDSFGSDTSLVRNNLITRGDATGVKAAVTIGGTFQFTGNRISGFDQPDSSALLLAPDPLGRTAQSFYRDNVFLRCTRIVPEAQKALWDTAEGSQTVTK